MDFVDRLSGRAWQTAVLLAACALLLLQLSGTAATAAASDEAGTGFQAAGVNYWGYHLAEGCTAGGMETFILVQNPNPGPVTFDIMLLTDSGMLNPPSWQGFYLNPFSRATFYLNPVVESYNVSAVVGVTSGTGGITCERAMYGDNRTWATDSVGAVMNNTDWYFAEGCTEAGMETFILVQNPYASATTVSLTLMTDAGPMYPNDLQNVVLKPTSRQTFNLGHYVTSYNVSTVVHAYNNGVVCERAMYGPGRRWATASVGVTGPAVNWYLAEGCTGGGMETFILVQNPNPTDSGIYIDFCTDAGAVYPTNTAFTIPARSRRTINLAEYMGTGYYHLGTRVGCTWGSVICERAMYGAGRHWATESIGSTQLNSEWYLAEGCTEAGMQTWVLIMNAGTAPVSYSVAFMTGSGTIVLPPELQNLTIYNGDRVSVNVGLYVTEYEVSTRVIATGAELAVERSMYGPGWEWGTNSIGIGGN